MDAYTQAQTDTKISDAVDAHNESATAHSDIRGLVATLEATVEAIELKFGTSSNGEPVHGDVFDPE